MARRNTFAASSSTPFRNHLEIKLFAMLMIADVIAASSGFNGDMPE